jgi:hypothetical protein
MKWLGAYMEQFQKSGIFQMKKNKNLNVEKNRNFW